MVVRFDCPHCKTGYEVADELAGKKIMCRHCQKRGQVRSLAANAPSASGLPASVALTSTTASRRKLLLIAAGVLASLGSITTGALLARRPWRHWNDPEPSPDATTRRRGPGRGPGGPPGAGGPPGPRPAGGV